MNTTDHNFYEALETQDLNKLARIPKSDLHNHAGRGGKIEDISHKIIPRTSPFESLDDMQDWFVENVKANIPAGVEGFLLRLEAAFIQAKRDSISKLALSFADRDVYNLGGMEALSEAVTAMKNRHIPHADFIPELSLLRSDVSQEELSAVEDFISFGWFKSIDICGNENAVTLDRYRPLYQYAQSKGLLLKAHVGEFGTAKDVMEAVALLELNEVHHGIASADSLECMKYLRDNKIILNICPMSNIMLKRAKDYASHPIKKLYHAGVPVTINTDDLTIFNATVSQEYLNLYKHGVFSVEELNDIRKNALMAYGKYK